MHRVGARSAWAIVLVALAVFATACTSEESAAPATSNRGGRRGGNGDGGPVPIVTASVVQKPMPVTVTAVGTAESISTVQIRSQVTGPLSQVLFSEGDEVRVGQPLFAIDPQTFQVALDQATAILARDTAQAKNARAQASRYQELLDRGLIPRDQFDTQTTNAAALDATVEADRAAVEAARLNLQHSRIMAPVSGRTGALMVHAGDLVQANATTPMVVINQLAPIYVTFAIPGKLLDEVRRYQSTAPLAVSARMSGEDEDPTPEVDGRVTFIDNAVDVQTGTIKLKATFGNAGRRLWPGQFVDVVLRLTTESKALVVPAVAVQSGQQGQFVYIVHDSKAEVRPVTVARTEGTESVIEKGLMPGETVVTDGQLRLTPGVAVRARVADIAGQHERQGEGS
jgi:multidrug efflux system membrane fusion protein